MKQYWAIPPEHSAEFVAAMEDVLAVYQRPLDPAHPVLCMDETSKQLVGETRISLPVVPSQPQREDYEYERHGVANLFLFSEPLTGWREVQVTERRSGSIEPSRCASCPTDTTRQQSESPWCWTT